jgi:hypothetical protein
MAAVTKPQHMVRKEGQMEVDLSVARSLEVKIPQAAPRYMRYQIIVCRSNHGLRPTEKIPYDPSLSSKY